jgi:hypothetical protein
VPSILDAHQVAVEAEEAIRRLPVARDSLFESLYSYLTVDEPSVHLLPLHFLPSDSGRVVEPATLHDLGVAAKLEYTRNRWLDEMVDAIRPSPVPLATHRLNDAVVALICERYERVLDNPVAAPFYKVLSGLYARHGLSVILDGQRPRCPERAMSLKDYVEHARARHGPMRAPLDALLLLVGASDRTIRKARVSWQNWALGVQFYDDALDVEEDYRDGNRSWVVSRTLERFRSGDETGDPSVLPDPGEFHELALTEGVVCRALAIAEGFFATAARQAGQLFPTWAAFQRECVNRTAGLRADYEEMIAEAKQV